MLNPPLQPPALKPGWQTTEFWISTTAMLGGLAGQAAGFIPPPYGLILTTVSVAAYSISRGLAKAQPSSIVVASGQQDSPVTVTGSKTS